MPADKAPGTSAPTESLLEAENCVFVGTSVVSGSATALVFATGQRPPSGISRSASQPGRPRPNSTAVASVRNPYHEDRYLPGAVHPAREYRDAQERAGISALRGRAGGRPDTRISSDDYHRHPFGRRRADGAQKVIVKHLVAIENFGSIDVLCTDKTGTLTAGEMTLDPSWIAFGDPAARAFSLAYLNSPFETGIKSPLDAAIFRGPAPPV